MKTLTMAMTVVLGVSASGTALAAKETTKAPVTGAASVEAPKAPAAKLIAAAKKGDVEAVKKQLKKGIKVDATTDELDAYTALGWAAYYGHKDVAELLLEEGASIDVQNLSGYTPLMAAAQTGHNRLVRFLLEKGANPNMATKNGDTALIYASMFGNAETVQALLEKGADRRATNKLGDTAETLANALGRSDVATVLAKSE
jgi:uncharacterized protein